MRHIGIDEAWRSGIAVTPAPESASIQGLCCPAVRYTGPIENVELANLPPGGQIYGAGSGRNGSGNTSNPEPVIGYGATKGIVPYYQTVLLFGAQPDTY